VAPQSVPGAEQMTGRAPQPFGSYPFFVAPGKRAATPLQTARGSFEDSRQRRLYGIRTSDPRGGAAPPGSDVPHRCRWLGSRGPVLGVHPSPGRRCSQNPSRIWWDM